MATLTSDLSPTDKLGLELLNACYFGNTALAIRLLENPRVSGGWMDPRDGWSPIHYAARWGKIAIIKALLERGVDINICTTAKETALHKACRSNRKNVCIFLLRHGADPTIVNGSGQRASELSADEEIQYVCDHFPEFMLNWEEVRKKIKSAPPVKKTEPPTSAGQKAEVANTKKMKR